ncbi:hypothetical protein [Streptomyces sp. ICN441]|uniref:hypothetical protein n=1 Tax=Streptomyces sp. ICN441 TaxID=2558286 RepID=UPI001F10DC5B|nr:hypothetical protein [Streptomyces sp. ICN441]
MTDRVPVLAGRDRPSRELRTLPLRTLLRMRPVCPATYARPRGPALPDALHDGRAAEDPARGRLCELVDGLRPELGRYVADALATGAAATVSPAVLALVQRVTHRRTSSCARSTRRARGGRAAGS